jgi:nucleoid-associated protein YgaU
VKPSATRGHSTPQPMASSGQVSAEEPVVQVAAAVVAKAASTVDAAAITRRMRFHVVRRGESLWSIASARLGRGASSAAVAGEVARLWALNRARIATGDPDLLPVGVRLRLR